MRKWAVVTIIACVPWIIGGCLSPSNTFVELVNNAEHPVEVTLYYGSSQYTTKELLEAFGTQRQFTLAAGQPAFFSDDCDRLQAIVIDKAELSLIGTIGPSTSSRVYRDGTDFGCGNTITFTFTEAQLGTEINIAFSQRR